MLGRFLKYLTTPICKMSWCHNYFWGIITGVGLSIIVFVLMIAARPDPYEPSAALLNLRTSKQSFDDVPTDHWAYDEIQLIYSYGITVGCSYDPPLYCPDRPMTRDEAAVFAARLLEIMEGK